jgi:Asp-tRNA(Asn)/Glu-tRNA(Gln) amidotransferase A subunit family amidase
VRAARTSRHLGSIWFLAEAEACAAAARLDERVRAGEPAGPLAGIPLLVKDSFDVAGMPGGAGGPVRHAIDDADVVAASRQAGAILLGKAAMHQLGWGMTGQCPGRPICHNPGLPGRSPGGSSSGSAAAVAAGIVPVALGGDTGGSVRLPAAWCGVVGFKPAQGAVSGRGVAPLAESFDTVGYLAASVDDCRLAHQALADGGEELPSKPVEGMRVAVDRELASGIEPEISAAFERALDALRRAGAVIVEESLPPHRVPVRQLYAAQFAANWGSIVDGNPELFAEDVLDGIAAGRATDPTVVSAGLAALERIRDEVTLEADVFACPTSPIAPLSLDAPDDVARAGRLLRPFNIFDWPAISVPCPGPVSYAGVQLAGPPGREGLIFALASVVEAAR